MKKRDVVHSDTLKISNIFVAVLCVFLGIIPWISRLKFWKLSEAMRDVFVNENGIYIDLFLYYKEVAVIGMGGIVLLFLLSEMLYSKRRKFKNNALQKRTSQKSTLQKSTSQNNTVQNNKRWEKRWGKRWILGCVLFFVVAVVLSAIFSKDRNTTIMGIPTEGEGVFALISYMLLMLGVLHYLQEEKEWKMLKYTLRFLMVVTILLTCVEFFYKPLFEIPFFQNMLAGAQYSDIVGSIENESFRNFVVLTFYNPNYFGGFCLLLIPFAAKDLMRSTTVIQRIGNGVCLAGLYFCVITAKSTTSFYLAIMEGIVLLGITWFAEKEARKKVLVNVGVFVISFAIVLLVAFMINGSKLGRVSISAIQNQRWQELETAKYQLDDIKIEENKLIFYMDEKILTVVSKEGAVLFYDGTGQPIRIRVRDNHVIELADEGYEGITVEISNHQFAFDFGYENLVYFYAMEDEFYGFAQNGKLIKTVSLGNMKERFGTEIYGWITGRGYAWVNTLPLLKETWLLGKGAGNFALYFPQHDYVGLLNTHGNHELVADKPHSMYMQIAVNQGVAGLGAILALFAGAGILYVKNRFSYKGVDWKSGMADAAFCVLLAFALYSGVNDSTVAVSPVFWIIFGGLNAVLSAMKNNKVA